MKASVLLVACSLLFGAAGLAADLPDFTKLVQDNSKSVVNVSTVRQVERSNRQLRNFNFEDFFRGIPRRTPIPNVQPRSLGSGFIISDDGYILTNQHVVDDAEEILVRFSDRRELVAELVGADSRSDLALLKVAAENLPKVRFGRSQDLQVGEWVVAIGSPFGFDYSVTAGIVSAKGRSLPTERNETYVPFIQTDVAINPGNSGGPLFNLDGGVVGINSQIYSRSGGFMGVSFAIPIDVAMEVVEQLKSDGRVSRGWLGVAIQEVSRELAESFGLERPHGALIAEVMEGSPAEDGGLQAGDVIIEFNGLSIERSVELPHYVGRVRADTEVSLKIVRGGEESIIEMKVGELPADDSLVLRGRGVAESSSLGLGLEDVPEAVRSRLDIEGGVRVVQSSGPAAQSGIRVGDIITQLGHQPVMDLASFHEIAESLPKGRSAPVRILRDGRHIFIALDVPE